MRYRGHVLVGGILFAAACGGGRPAGSETARASTSGGDSTPMRSMPMLSMDMLPTIRAHLDSIVGAEPGELAGMVAGHRVRMDQVLLAMDHDMKAMNMTGDAAWQALADSVRADLGAIPGLSGEALLLRMRAHAGQTRRLLALHERMMSQMRM